MSEISKYTALYYPYTVLLGDNPNPNARTTSLLKTALLMWDHLEFIVPDEAYDLNYKSSNPLYQRAMRVIGEKVVPDGTQKRLAHRFIENLANSNLPPNFRWENERHVGDAYQVYPAKFLGDTFQVLEKAGLAIRPKNELHETDWAMCRNLGMAIMAMLAEACAGATKRMVTDEVDSYHLLARSLANAGVTGHAPATSDVERLVTIAVKIVDPDQFSLEDLIALREREKEGSGPELRMLRHNFLNKVDLYVAKMASLKGSTADVREIERQFEQDMKDDYAQLRNALKWSKTNALASKEVGIGTLAAAGSAIYAMAPAVTALASVLPASELSVPVTLFTGLTAITGLVKGAMEYKADRRKALGEHAMSWLVAV